MALTVANVSTPNSEIHEGQFLGLRGRIVDITFDSSYLTGGEVLTAATMGWTYLFGAVPLTHPTNTAGTVMAPAVVKKNTAGSQLTFQLAEGAATADDNPLKEVGSTQDMSTYTGRFVVLGY